jgi:hypothetical protein
VVRVTKICRLSWLTNSAFIYEPKCGGGEGGCGPQPMRTAVHCTWSPNKLWRSNSIFTIFIVWERVVLLRYFIFSLFNSRSGRAGSCPGTSSTRGCRPGTPRKEDRRWSGAAQRGPRRERGAPAPSCGDPGCAIGWRSRKTTFRRSFPFPR